MSDTYVLPFSKERVRRLSLDPNPIFGKLCEQEVDIIYNYMTAEGSETRALAYENFWTASGRNHPEVEAILNLFDRFLNYNHGSHAMDPVELFKILDQLDIVVLEFFLNLPDTQEVYRTLIGAFQLQVRTVKIIDWCEHLQNMGLSLFEQFKVYLIQNQDYIYDNVYDNELIYNLSEWIME